MGPSLRGSRSLSTHAADLREADDQSWVNFSTPRLGTLQHFDPALMALTLCLGIVIVVIAALLLSWVIRPLRGLAEAAERFSLDGEWKPLDDSGPARSS